MPLYEVSLSRTYVLKVEANSSRDAVVLSEFFLGYKDDSNEDDKNNFGFEIQGVDLTTNDVLEVKKVGN